METTKLTKAQPRRRFTAPRNDDRCTANVVLKDGSGAQCMHRRQPGSAFCHQHIRAALQQSGGSK